MTTLRLEQILNKISSLRSEEFTTEPERNSVEAVVYEDLIAIEKLLNRELRKRRFEHTIERPGKREDKIG